MLQCNTVNVRVSTVHKPVFERNTVHCTVHKSRFCLGSASQCFFCLCTCKLLPKVFFNYHYHIWALELLFLQRKLSFYWCCGLSFDRIRKCKFFRNLSSYFEFRDEKIILKTYCLVRKIMFQTIVKTKFEKIL